MGQPVRGVATSKVVRPVVLHELYEASRKGREGVTVGTLVRKYEFDFGWYVYPCKSMRAGERVVWRADQIVRNEIVRLARKGKVEKAGKRGSETVWKLR